MRRKRAKFERRNTRLDETDYAPPPPPPLATDRDRDRDREKRRQQVARDWRQLEATLSDFLSSASHKSGRPKLGHRSRTLVFSPFLFHFTLHCSLHISLHLAPPSGCPASPKGPQGRLVHCELATLSRPRKLVHVRLEQDELGSGQASSLELAAARWRLKVSS